MFAPWSMAKLSTLSEAPMYYSSLHRQRFDDGLSTLPQVQNPQYHKLKVFIRQYGIAYSSVWQFFALAPSQMRVH